MFPDVQNRHFSFCYRRNYKIPPKSSFPVGLWDVEISGKYQWRQSLSYWCPASRFVNVAFSKVIRHVWLIFTAAVTKELKWFFYPPTPPTPPFPSPALLTTYQVSSCRCHKHTSTWIWNTVHTDTRDSYHLGYIRAYSSSVLLGACATGTRFHRLQRQWFDTSWDMDQNKELGTRHTAF